MTSPPPPSDRPLDIGVIMRALPGASGSGGVSYQAHFLAQHLVARGHRVTIYSADPAPPDARYSVVQIPVPEERKQKQTFLYFGFPRLVARQDFSRHDVVHAHGDSQFLLRPKVPVVRTYWGSDLGEALGDLRPKRVAAHLVGYAFEHLARFGAARTIGISENTRRMLPFIDEVIPPGIDLEELAFSEVRSPRPSILFVAGTLGGRKRGHLLVDVFRREVRPAIPDAELWLVCPERVEGEGIVWFGRLTTAPEERKKLVRLFQTAWVFCLPSSYEGFGIPYIEAMACGALVVATPNAGSREIVTDGEDGLLAAPARLGATLVRGLTTAELRRRLVQRARPTAERFAWPQATSHYEAAFRSVPT